MNWRKRARGCRRARTGTVAVLEGVFLEDGGHW